MWSDLTGSLQSLATEGDQLPAMPAGSGIEVPLGTLISDETVYLFAEFAGGNSVDLQPEGFWRTTTNGTIEPVAVTGMQAPGLPSGVVFGQTDNNIVIGSIGTVGLNRIGNYAFVGFTKGPGITLTNDEAIWVETQTGMQLLVREGDTPPDGDFPGGSLFASGSVLQGAFAGQAMPAIRINDNGAVVFPAQVDIPGDPPRVPTIWTNRNGELELIMEGQQVGVAFSEPGDPAPGVPDGTFITAIGADINDRGDIMLLALAETDNNIFTSVFGAWIDRGNGIAAVGFEEGPVPDHPGITFIPETNGVRGIRNALLNPDGSVLFVGHFFDQQNQFTTGAFLQSSAGGSNLLFETGSTIELIDETGSTVRTIDAFRFGEGVTDNGLRIVEVFFTDGTAGLYTIDLTPVVPGDLDEDGVVGVSDLLELLSQWNTKNDAADLNNDGVVGVSDLLILLANWG
jgi:hypothetical protein